MRPSAPTSDVVENSSKEMRRRWVAGDGRLGAAVAAMTASEERRDDQRRDCDRAGPLHDATVTSTASSASRTPSGAQLGFRLVPRDQRLMVISAGLAAALVLLGALAGFEELLAYAAPVLVLVLPLLAGRFVGESASRWWPDAFGGVHADSPSLSPPGRGFGADGRHRAADV